jgi:hypothetical protein
VPGADVLPASDAPRRRARDETVADVLPGSDGPRCRARDVPGADVLPGSCTSASGLGARLAPGRDHPCEGLCFAHKYAPLTLRKACQCTALATHAGVREPAQVRHVLLRVRKAKPRERVRQMPPAPSPTVSERPDPKCPFATVDARPRRRGLVYDTDSSSRHRPHCVIGQPEREVKGGIGNRQPTAAAAGADDSQR